MTVAQPCPVRLPQNVPSDSSCAQQRRKELAVEQATYRLTSDNPTGPFALVDLSPAELTEIIRKDPFMRPYALQYRSLIAGVSGVLRAYVNRTEGQQISGLGDFAGIRQHFRLAVQDLFGVRTVNSVRAEQYHLHPRPGNPLNPFTPKSDQFQISPAASPEI